MRTAIAVFIAALITACSSTGPPAATTVVSSPTPTATTAASATATAAPASPTGRVLPPGITDLALVFKPLASGWRPTGTTLVVARAMVSGDITLVAVSLGPRGGAPTPIVSFVPNTWALRADGGALAVSVWTGRGSRIAIWDVRSGSARWLTADEPGKSALSPLWSKDGTSIYYALSADDGKSLGMFQIGADGSGLRQIREAEGFGGTPEGLTPDGGGLVWSRIQAGGSVEILDLASGANRVIENNASLSSWRTRQPRALVRVGGCCAGRPGGALVLWDDVAMTSRVVAARGQSGDPAWGGGVWDPAGTRIAAVRFDSTSPYEGSLVVIDESGASQPIPDTRGVGHVLWLTDGLVFTRPLRIGVEVMILPGGEGPAASLYQDSGLIQRIDVVHP